MNNIYKVIWSKAKNCYVVASEIARSHTKSASGSEKIGGDTRRKLLASLMALSLLCGGLGVAEASVHVVESGETYEVYTTGETYSKETANAKLDLKADKTDVATNTANIANLENNKLSKADASNTYATKADVNTELANKADKTYVDTELTKKADVTALGEYAKTADVNTELANKVDKTYVDTELAKKADQADLDTANGEITDLQNKTAKLSPDGTKLTDMTTVETGTLKVTGGISNDTGVTTTLTDIDNSMKQTATNTGEIANLKTKTDGQQTAIDDLKKKTTKIDYDAANDTTSINGIDIGDAQVDMKGKNLTGVGTINGTKIGTNTDGEYIRQDNSIWGNMKIVDTQVKTNADNIKTNTTAITTLDTKVGEIDDRTGGITRNPEDTQTTIEGSVKVDKQGNVKDVKGLSAETITTQGDATIGGKLGVTGETTLGGTLTAKGEATFEKAVTVQRDLTVDGKLNVGEISMKNNTHEPTGKVYDSSTSISADGISNQAKVTDEIGNSTESKFTHNEKGTFNYAKDQKITGEWKGSTSNVTADGVSNKMTDSAGNTHTYYQTAAETKEQLVNGNKSNFEKKTAEGNTISIKDKDADGNKKSLTNKQTVDGEKTSVTNKDSSSTVNQGADQIRNYVASTDGTKSSTEVKADGITNTSDGTITNDANHIENKANTMDTTVTGKVTENYNGGQETNVKGDQDIKVSGTRTTTATDIKRNASSGMIDTIDNDYGTNTETKVAGKTTTDVSIKGTGEKGQYIRGANESRDYLIKGTLKNSETKTAEATSTKITDGNGKTSSTIQDVTQISGSVTDGTNTSVSNVKANSIDSAVTDGSSISTINQKKNSITSQVTDGTTITKTEQDTKNITNTAKDGTITNDAKDIVNNASGNMTNTVGGDLTTTVSGNELHEVTGKQTNKINGDQENTIGGNQTTTVTGDISNKAENITNEANTKLTDKVGENTRVLDGEGITDAVGGSTFKQRIDKIMMESKDVSIKAEETLTNEAKVITNKASEVINNEAVNINNTATGIITSKASEIKNQADKLISNKVGENTWENMENGKITTSIKDGAKQNLTQSDAVGTTQSTVDGGKSTVTIQNADGLADAVTDGTNTSVQNQTASAIAAAVKDGAGNENASVANATTSVNTIKSGSKANTVISTADGTSFINSEAAAPVGDGTEVKTTIKGNTITTGKVTMDYAEVMKDLGVRGNANITGKTTTGSLEVTGTSTLKGDVTMGSNATVKKDLTVEGNTNLKNTKVDGTLDVTQKATFGDSVSIAKDLSVDGNATIKGDVTAKSYKVGDKTYISAAGINANDQKITNVADGSISEGSKDAVNGGQLYGVKNDLEGKVNKVGANAAAMANLHPMEFDPDSKWNIAAAIGNYGSETAAALGAFYRPNDDVMVNLSTAFGTGENMVGGGVSVRLGKGGNKLSREESNALKDQVNDLTARMDALLSVLNPNMSKDFPDVPENHWAYEAVSRLAGNDIVQGYPDGEFHGERTMTRYEMAEIIYNALSRGAEAEKELVEEFKPELQAMAASEKATAEKAEG